MGLPIDPVNASWKSSWEEFVILLARVSLGVFFAISGGNKLCVAG